MDEQLYAGELMNPVLVVRNDFSKMSTTLLSTAAHFSISTFLWILARYPTMANIGGRRSITGWSSFQSHTQMWRLVFGCKKKSTSDILQRELLYQTRVSFLLFTCMQRVIISAQRERTLEDNVPLMSGSIISSRFPQSWSWNDAHLDRDCSIPGLKLCDKKQSIHNLEIDKGWEKV